MASAELSGGLSGLAGAAAGANPYAAAFSAVGQAAQAGPSHAEGEFGGQTQTFDFGQGFKLKDSYVYVLGGVAALGLIAWIVKK